MTAGRLAAVIPKWHRGLIASQGCATVPCGCVSPTGHACTGRAGIGRTLGGGATLFLLVHLAGKFWGERMKHANRLV
jgi:hypothetical protein